MKTIYDSVTFLAAVVVIAFASFQVYLHLGMIIGTGKVHPHWVHSEHKHHHHKASKEGCGCGDKCNCDSGCKCGKTATKECICNPCKCCPACKGNVACTCKDCKCCPACKGHTMPPKKDDTTQSSNRRFETDWMSYDFLLSQYVQDEFRKVALYENGELDWSELAN